MLHEAATQVGAAFIIGGRGITSEIRRKLQAVSYGESMRELIAFATPLYVLTPPPPPTPRESRIVY